MTSLLISFGTTFKYEFLFKLKGAAEMMSEHKRKSVARLRKENCYVPDNYDDGESAPTTSKVQYNSFTP
jgi:hypothetical protein